MKREETHQPRDLGCIARDMLRFYTGAYLITEAEERIFRPLWDAHRNGTLVADPPPDSPVAAAFNFYDTNYRNHFYPCLCHFARKLRPPGPYAAHAAPPNLVDVVFAYADASAATLAAEGRATCAAGTASSPRCWPARPRWSWAAARSGRATATATAGSASRGFCTGCRDVCLCI